MPHPVLNEPEALERLSDKEFLKEMLLEFSKMTELDWNVFEKHKRGKNIKAMEEISHSIKGVSGNLSLTGIFHAAKALNDTIKLGETEFINRYFEELKLEVERFRGFLDKYLNS
jgi:HPt (histidine-containing phosphotransfer) domain-containing protein